MNEVLDKLCLPMTELEISVAIDTCKRAGAVNAANALGKYIVRLQVEIELLKKKLDTSLGKENEPQEDT